ncbi:MAG: hypothetical protein HFJ89_03545 [Oscillospiraceae bacterium]|jgi:predicted RNA-binding protein associated with RNAse of E/G family|nr:hypothetical protein [Oscillospiraceae bacterium]
MNKKRLDRDKKWGFQGFPYYQMRMDNEDFHGLVSVIKLVAGDYFFWEKPKAGKTPVCGEGMLWLQLIPDGQYRAITAKFLPESRTVQGVKYFKSVSIWYVDVIDGWGYDDDGVAYFTDQYLDVVFDIEGDIITEDRDELDEAYRSGELSEEQYQRAVNEGNAIVSELCSDVQKTQLWCENILRLAMKRIKSNDNVFKKNV